MREPARERRSAEHQVVGACFDGPIGDLDDPALPQHELKIAIPQRPGSVRNHDCRPACSQPLHNVNLVGFRTGVEGAGKLGHGCNAFDDESIVISDSIARNPTRKVEGKGCKCLEGFSERLGHSVLGEGHAVGSQALRVACYA